MIAHADFTKEEIRKMIVEGAITLGGNQRLKIYGLLTCASGKRMKKVNRVFFSDEQEAKQCGFRPCGHCIRRGYISWKNRHRGKQKN